MIAANLTGPAASLVVNTFHTAQSEYNTLAAAVPEPTAATLLLTGAALATLCAATNRRGR